MNFAYIARQLMDKKYKLTALGDCVLEDGTILHKKMLDSPTFIHSLKIATVQATVSKMQHEKEAIYGGQVHIPADQVTESEKGILKELGLTEESYLKIVNQMGDFGVIVKGAFNDLYYPGLKKEFAEGYTYKPKKAEEILEISNKYAVDQVVRRPADEELKVLRVIVAAILLSPKSLKIEDNCFIVPADTMDQVDRNFRLEYEYDQREQTYRVRLR